MVTKKRNAGPATLVADPFLANLGKIDHLVILMMENRSFDQILGYLKVAGGRTDVDGLTGTETNTWQPATGAPVTVQVHPLTGAARTGPDPCHDGDCVDEQVSNGNGGFVANYHRTYPADADPGVVMGYFQASDLPTYDFLAAEFAIGDRWFASVLGATWPNRLYMTSGMCAKSRTNRSAFGGTQYRNKSWVRHLDAAGVSWKGYGDASYGHCSIKFTDANYRSSENYEPFAGSLTGFGFMRDAETGQLPSVSVIDPTFFKNDDHPPADVSLGQTFVARAYNALAKSPAWERTLMVVVYDEHGGFFDHVVPGPAADDDPDCRSYGVRVPVFFIGAHVTKGRCFHTTWDHASIVKTILLRFCTKNGAIPDMGARVAAATHIGEVLSEPVARPAKPMPAPAVSALMAEHTRLSFAEFSAPRPTRPITADEALLNRTLRQLQATAAKKAPARKKSAGAAKKAKVSLPKTRIPRASAKAVPRAKPATPRRTAG